MNKFWEWMKENNYICKDDEDGECEQCITEYKETKQTTIGYMIQYLMEVKKRQIANLMNWSIVDNIDELYKYLLEEIDN